MDNPYEKSHWRVLCAIAHHLDTTGVGPSWTDLERATGLGRSSIGHALRTLEAWPAGPQIQRAAYSERTLTLTEAGWATYRAIQARRQVSS